MKEGGPPNLQKREKTSQECVQIHCVLVVNSYAEPLPSHLPILYPSLKTSGFQQPGIFVKSDHNPT